jgi:hypothetical protein
MCAWEGGLASYLAGLRITKRNISASILADVKRFFHQINTDEVFGTHRGWSMIKILTVTTASLAMLSAAAAADLPRKEPPPPAPPVGKAPIGKYPVGKAPIGKYPQPVVTKG